MKVESQDSNQMSYKPTYDVGYWEYVYQIESKTYIQLIIRKARYLQRLEEMDLFSIPESEAISIANRICRLSAGYI